MLCRLEKRAGQRLNAKAVLHMTMLPATEMTRGLVSGEAKAVRVAANVTHASHSSVHLHAVVTWRRETASCRCRCHPIQFQIENSLEYSQHVSCVMMHYQYGQKDL